MYCGSTAGVRLLLTLQFAVQFLFLLLQSTNPLLKNLHLLPSCSTICFDLDTQPRPADRAAVGEAAVGGVGEANEGEVLPCKTSVRHWRSNVL